MFCEAREQMRKKVTLKKKSDPGQFAVTCTVKGIEFPHTLCDTGASVSNLPRIMADHMGLQISCPLQPYSSKKPHTTSRRINDPGVIAACQCGAEYETEYSASIETHTATSIDSDQQKSTDGDIDESVDSSPEEWENDYYNPTMAAHNMHIEEYDEDYEEQRAIEQRAILDEEDRLLHHSSWKKKSTSIGTQPHQPSHLRASTDIAYYPSIDTNVDATRDGDYSIGSWADDRHHESYAVETTYHDQGADELHEGFTYKELLNMQRCDKTDQKRAETAWGRTHFSHPIDRAIPPSIDINPSTSIDINYTTSIDSRPTPKTTVSEKDKSDNQYLTPDKFGIFRDPDGYAKAIDGQELMRNCERPRGADCKKPHTTSRGINDPGVIAACQCGAEYETEYSASIETHTATSIDSDQHKSTDGDIEESVDSSPEEWENDYYNPTMAAHNMHKEEYDEDYEEQRAIEQRAILDEEDRLLHHSSWKKKSTSIDTQPHQPSHLRASTDIAYYPSIDTNVDANVDATRDGDYSIGSWADDRHHESYAVETTYHDQGADELHEGFTYKELLNMQRCDKTDQKRAETAWGRTHFSHPIDRAIPPSIDINPSTLIDINYTTSIDSRPTPKTTVSEKDKSDNQYLTPDKFGIFRDPDGYAKSNRWT
ncbi:hypothetical protein F2Q68_00005189 [Brassica cretica]|uniref:Retropepsins domain-containing protein n=1 Tax=Brassica cretica TaxID=69181 RepID=A0A8S9JJ09_BRACR|nr:hypothetical protein F2Q68_00005189 [Brassica cretica]